MAGGQDQSVRPGEPRLLHALCPQQQRDTPLQHGQIAAAGGRLAEQVGEAVQHLGDLHRVAGRLACAGLGCDQQHAHLADGRRLVGCGALELGEMPLFRRDVVELDLRAVPVARPQRVQRRIDRQGLAGLEDRRRAAVLGRVLDLEAGRERARRLGIEGEIGACRGRRARPGIEQRDQLAQAVPLGRGANEGLVGVGVEIFGQHVGRAGEGAQNLPAVVAALVLVLRGEPRLARGRVLVRRNRVALGQIQPARLAGALRIVGLGERLAQPLEVGHGVAVDVAEALEPGAVPAGQIGGPHPASPPCARIRRLPRSGRAGSSSQTAISIPSSTIRPPSVWSA